MVEDYSKFVSDEWDFGSDKALADRLKDLVLSGKKSATTDMYRADTKIPAVGAYAAISGSDKKRFCVIQYTKVEVKPFLKVDFAYAFLEGEGQSLESWRDQHRQFFTREYGAFKDDSLVLCEQFKLIQKLA